MISALAFPGTESWSTYGKVAVTANLPAGLHRLSLVYADAQGSADWLNLDHLTLSAPAYTPPPLSVRWAGDGLDLSWPLKAGGFAP